MALDQAWLKQQTTAALDPANPRYPKVENLDHYDAELARIQHEAVPILAMDEGSYSSNPSMLPAWMRSQPGIYLPPRVVLDPTGRPDEAAIRKMVRLHSDVGIINADVLTSWMMMRSKAALIALLFVDVWAERPHGVLHCAFHVIFDVRNAQHRAMINFIELTGSLSFDTHLKPANPHPIFQTDALGKRTDFFALGGLGMNVQVTSSLLSALSRDSLYRIVTEGADSISQCWGLILALDGRLNGTPLPRPKMKRKVIVEDNRIRLVLCWAEWFSDPHETGLQGMGDVRLHETTLDEAPPRDPTFAHALQQYVVSGKLPGSTISKSKYASWRSVALSAPIFADVPDVLRWQLILQYDPKRVRDPYMALTDVLALKVPIEAATGLDSPSMLRNRLPIDFLVPVYFLARMASLPRLHPAWCASLISIQTALVPVVLALTDEYAAGRDEPSPIAAFDDNDVLKRLAGLVRTALRSLCGPLLSAGLASIEPAKLDSGILLAFERLAQIMWQTDRVRKVLLALLSHAATNADNQLTIATINALQALAILGLWSKTPPNPLHYMSIHPTLTPFQFFQTAILWPDLPKDMPPSDLLWLHYDLIDSFTIPEPHSVTDTAQLMHLAPWTKARMWAEAGRVGAYEREQIQGTTVWLLDQVAQAEAKMRARPAVGRAEQPVEPGFTALRAGHVERLRIVAYEDRLIIRLVLREGEGGMLLAWFPDKTPPVWWRMLLPENITWELALICCGLWRDLRVSGRDQVLVADDTPRCESPRAAAPHRPRGRQLRPVELPQTRVERIRLVSMNGPIQRVSDTQRRRWAPPEEREYIARAKHAVGFTWRHLPENWKASDELRGYVQSLGLPPLPERGLTVVRPHTRGTDTGDTRVREIK